MVPGQPMSGPSKRQNGPCFIMGPHVPLPEFCGRSELLKQLHSTLIPSKELSKAGRASHLQTFALYGIGGIGKTQLAVTFAYECKERQHFNHIFWVQSEDPGKLAKSFGDIALKLGLEESNENQVVSRDLVLEWLSDPEPRPHDGFKHPSSEGDTPRWLVIFDNADDLSILRDYWPVTGRGSILITSRDPLAKTQTYFQCDGGINLEPFQPHEAISLIESLTGFSNAADHPVAATIAEKLSYIPMAVNHAAKTINRRSFSLPEFLRYYEQEELREGFYQLGIGSPHSTKDSAPKTIATVWALQDLSPRASRLFDIISFMDPDQIWESLLTGVAGHRPLSNAGSIPVPLNNSPTQVNEFLLARTELSSSSLISRNVKTEELTTHRIVQDISRLQMVPARYEKAFGAVCQLLYLAWPFSEFDFEPTRWPLCEPVISHITNLGELYRSKRAAISAGSNIIADLARLLMDAGW